MTTSKWDLLDRLGSIVVALAAVVVVGLALLRERETPKESEAPSLTAARVPEWNAVRDAAARISDGGSLLIVQFGDFECPFCRQFASTVRALPDSTKALVTEAFVNFPLSSHRFAFQSAIEFQCAADLGYGRSLHDRLFAAQDSLSLLGPRIVLESVGIATHPEHSDCIDSGRARQRVEASVELGRLLKVNMTPTVIVNGWRLSRPPNVRELDSLVNAISVAR